MSYLRNPRAFRFNWDENIDVALRGITGGDVDFEYEVNRRFLCIEGKRALTRNALEIYQQNKELLSDRLKEALKMDKGQRWAHLERVKDGRVVLLALGWPEENFIHHAYRLNPNGDFSLIGGNRELNDFVRGWAHWADKQALPPERICEF